MYFKVTQNEKFVGLERYDCSCSTISIEHKKDIREVEKQLAAMQLDDKVIYGKEVWERIQ